MDHTHRRVDCTDRHTARHYCEGTCSSLGIGCSHSLHWSTQFHTGTMWNMEQFQQRRFDHWWWLWYNCRPKLTLGSGCLRIYLAVGLFVHSYVHPFVCLFVHFARLIVPLFVVCFCGIENTSFLLQDQSRIQLFRARSGSLQCHTTSLLMCKLLAAVHRWVSRPARPVHRAEAK